MTGSDRWPERIIDAAAAHAPTQPAPVSELAPDAPTPLGVPRRCGHCGRTVGDYAGGWARDGAGVYLCHPNEAGRPDCYMLVTNSLYGHTVAPCARCDADVGETCRPLLDGHGTVIASVRGPGPLSPEAEDAMRDLIATAQRRHEADPDRAEKDARQAMMRGRNRARLGLPPAEGNET